MKDTIRISKNLALPVETVTQAVAILAKRRMGKALALDTPIPTPSGWTTMGALQPGDLVFDECGHPTPVIRVSPVQIGRPCFRVVFNDGTAIIADEQHLWLTETSASRGSEYLTNKRAQLRGVPGRQERPQCVRRNLPKVVTTGEIAATLCIREGKRERHNHSIANCEALLCPEAELPIDPYVLGVWLGDGTAQNSYITTADAEVLQELAAAGYAVGSGRAQSGRCAAYRVGKDRSGTPFQTQLRKLDLLDNKHVPAAYLRASPRQRLSLLQGLMDSDGTISATSNACVFTNKNKALADAVAELVVSLGWVARRGSRRAKLYGKDCGVSFAIYFRPTASVFRLPRKGQRLQLDVPRATSARRRMIVAVDSVESVPVKCIEIGTDRRLYLAGLACVPTHNSYLARKLAEGLHAAGQQLVIIDPKGDWWGIRSSADGKSDGLPILIIGGEHGDIPLDAGAGETIAKLVVEEQVSVLLDLSELRKHEIATFMPAFMEPLYRLKAREQYRTPLMVLTDEADAIAPQKPQPNEARMLGAFNDLVRRGGQRGIGVTFITQRSAVLSKDVLTQAQILIALRVIAPQDLAAIKAWVDVHGTTEEQKTLMASLPSLPVGDAWVWSPGWPTDQGIFKRIHTLPIDTFDSGATPKPGEKSKAPKRLADIDLEAVKRQMAETLERAKADDPAALRARIAELEEQVEQAKVMLPEAVEVPVPTFDEESFRRLFEVIDERTSESIAAITQAKNEINQQLVTYRDAIREVVRENGGSAVPAPAVRRGETIVHRDPKPAKAAPPVAPRPAGTQTSTNGAGTKVTGGELAILTAVAQHRAGCTREQLTVLTGYKRSSRDTFIQRLTAAGRIDKDGDRLVVTDRGRADLGPDFKPLPKGAGLREFWLNKLGGGERVILEQLVKAYPKALTRTELSERTDYQRSSRDTFIQRLSSRELVVSKGGGVQANPELF